MQEYLSMRAATLWEFQAALWRSKPAISNPRLALKTPTLSGEQTKNCGCSTGANGTMSHRPP
jgi:hypothetical protein